MDFPLTRHYQRYEYVLLRNFVYKKVVMDVGAGDGYGSKILARAAKTVYSVDPNLLSTAYVGNVIPVPESIYDMIKKVDVCVAIEVFEHMQEPRSFIKKLSELCEYTFITTPLAEVTGKTRNKEHVAEYSSGDFGKIVEGRFEILEKRYQKSDMRIELHAYPNGDTLDNGHVVQMLWARRRNGR